MDEGQLKWVGELKQVGGSKNGSGATRMGGGKLKWVVSGTYSV